MAEANQELQMDRICSKMMELKEVPEKKLAHATMRAYYVEKPFDNDSLQPLSCKNDDLIFHRILEYHCFYVCNVHSVESGKGLKDVSGGRYIPHLYIGHYRVVPIGFNTDGDLKLPILHILPSDRFETDANGFSLCAHLPTDSLIFSGDPTCNDRITYVRDHRRSGDMLPDLNTCHSREVDSIENHISLIKKAMIKRPERMQNEPQPKNSKSKMTDASSKQEQPLKKEGKADEAKLREKFVFFWKPIQFREDKENPLTVKRKGPKPPKKKRTKKTHQGSKKSQPKRFREQEKLDSEKPYVHHCMEDIVEEVLQPLHLKQATFNIQLEKTNPLQEIIDASLLKDDEISYLDLDLKEITKLSVSPTHSPKKGTKKKGDAGNPFKLDSAKQAEGSKETKSTSNQIKLSKSFPSIKESLSTDEKAATLPRPSSKNKESHCPDSKSTAEKKISKPRSKPQFGDEKIYQYFLHDGKFKLDVNIPPSPTSAPLINPTLSQSDKEPQCKDNDIHKNCITIVPYCQPVRFSNVSSKDRIWWVRVHD